MPAAGLWGECLVRETTATPTAVRTHRAAQPGVSRMTAPPAHPLHTHLGRTAVGLWLVLLGVTCVRPLFQPTAGTVYPIYATAGAEFAAGRRLYDVPHPHTSDGFRYAPAVAAGLVPFAGLPPGVGGLAWRAVGAVVFLTGLAAWARRVCPGVRREGVFLLALPLSLGSLYNGQANPHVLGLLLWAAVLAADGRWGWAAVPVAGAVLFKGYPLAVGLLVCLAAPARFGVPLVLALFAGLALPYLAQSPDYVTDQYRYWWENLSPSRNDRSGFPLFAGYQDLHMLLRVAGAQVPAGPYRLVQLAAGAAAAGLIGWQVRRGLARPELVFNALTLGLCWMTLFGPSTESSTYILMAPVLARELADRRGRPAWARASAGVGAGLLVAAVAVFALPHAIHRPVIAAGVQPLGALLLTASAVGRVVAARPAAEAVRAADSTTPLRRAA